MSKDKVLRDYIITEGTHLSADLDYITCNLEKNKLLVVSDQGDYQKVLFSSKKENKIMPPDNILELKVTNCFFRSDHRAVVFIVEEGSASDSVTDRLYGFWRESTKNNQSKESLTFFRGGEVKKVEDEWQTLNGKTVLPIKVVPYAAGIKKNEQLQILYMSYQKTIRRKKAEYYRQMNEFLSELTDIRE